MLHSQRQQELAKERADAEVRVKIEKTKDSGYATNNTVSYDFLPILQNVLTVCG